MAEHTLDGVGTVVKKNGYTAEVKLIDEGWESRVTFAPSGNVVFYLGFIFIPRWSVLGDASPDLRQC